jgi:prepilin-type N-terminal cleavage/methylation domain-containing protein/prepilin-type processing-associated H-X9-DG protein
MMHGQVMGIVVPNLIGRFLPNPDWNLNKDYFGMWLCPAALMLILKNRGILTMSEKKTGFTLIELLVVIAIIALLLSVLLPSLNKAKRSAKSVVCRSNLKQLGYATLTYANENDNKTFPQFMNGKYHLYLFSILPYIGDAEDLRTCPSTKVVHRAADLGFGSYGSAKSNWLWAWDNADYPLPANPGPADYRYGSYGFNAWLYSTKTGDESFGKRITEVSPQATTPMFADSYFVGASPRATDVFPANFDLSNEHTPGVWDTTTTGAGMMRFMLNRHGNKDTNVCFVDGHVDKVELERFWALKWHRGYTPPTARPVIPR